VVGADTLAEKYGADTARMFVLSNAPPEREVDWRAEGAAGTYRFLGRVYRFATRNLDRAGQPAGSSDKKVLRKLHQTVRKVTEDFETRWHFNTCIAAVSELVNLLYAEEANIGRATKGRCSATPGPPSMPCSPKKKRRRFRSRSTESSAPASTRRLERLGRTWKDPPWPTPRYSRFSTASRW
jgi:hypothetical protein